MNLKERDEWLKALGACFPAMKVAAMAEACAKIEEPGVWEAVVRGGTLTRAGMRFLPARKGASWQAAAWDLETGAGGPFLPEKKGKEAKFKPGVFGEPALDRALRDFHALCPIEAISFQGEGWSLRFALPPRWPLFARCEISGAFTQFSSQLALFLLDRRVTGLEFDGEALWARVRG